MPIPALFPQLFAAAFSGGSNSPGKFFANARQLSQPPTLNLGNTQYAGLEEHLARQLRAAQMAGSGGQATEFSRMLDDLGLFSSIYQDPSAGINRFFNISAGNLGQRGETARSRAQSTAGAQAGARNLVNPSAFVLGAGNQAFDPFARGLQQLEAGRASALQQAEQQRIMQLLNLIFGRSDMRAQRNAQIEANTPNALDYFNAFGNIGRGVATAAFGGGGG